MSRFAQICKGKRARSKTIEFTGLDGSEHKVQFRLLDGNDSADIVAAAAAFAKAKGGEPKEGDHQFDLELAVQTVARACVDPDSPEDDPQPYFDSADEARGQLDFERFSFLYEAQKIFQDSIAVRKAELSDLEYIETVVRLANAEEGDALPFVHWRPALLWSFTRTLAAQYVSLESHKSPSLLGSASNTSADSASAKRSTRH